MSLVTGRLGNQPNPIDLYPLNEPQTGKKRNRVENPDLDEELPLIAKKALLAETNPAQTLLTIRDRAVEIKKKIEENDNENSILSALTQELLNFLIGEANSLYTNSNLEGFELKERTEKTVRKTELDSDLESEGSKAKRNSPKVENSTEEMHQCMDPDVANEQLEMRLDALELESEEEIFE